MGSLPGLRELQMPVHNKEISRLLNETADLLDIKGANEFRVRAYRNAARSVESLPRPAAEMVAEGEDLSKEDGIGKSLSEKIEEIVETGSLSQLEELKEELPPGLLELLDIPELGPRRAGQLYKELGVDGLDSL
jgi:DNA polymerase (family 10)